jgi:type I site-specific restriction endonuclease
MTVEEVRELLTVCLHGPLPQETVYRMMATLAEWMDLPKQLAANAKMLAQQTDLARQAENERDEAMARLRELDEAGTGYSQQTMDAVVRERDALKRQLAHYRAEDAIPDSTWQETLDRALEELEKARAAYHAEFDKREGIRAWWKEHVYVPDFEEDLECEDESLEELRDLIADWSFDEAVELRSKDERIERLEIELEQARAAADGCRFRRLPGPRADTGQYECPAFPYKNQAGGS